MSGTRRGSVSPWARSSRKARVAPPPVAGHERVDEAPHLALGRRRGDGLDLLDADAGALAVLERELLELAQEALLALADVGDRAPWPPLRRA